MTTEIAPKTNAQLLSAVERIERLSEEKAGLGNDIKDIYAELRGKGFDAKVIRLLIKRRAEDKERVREADELLALYEAAIGA